LREAPAIRLSASLIIACVGIVKCIYLVVLLLLLVTLPFLLIYDEGNKLGDIEKKEMGYDVIIYISKHGTGGLNEAIYKGRASFHLLVSIRL
jgi:hypothetical protein